MWFQSTKGDVSISFADTLGRAYPGGDGFWAPEGGVDIGSAVYAPEAEFADVVALAAAELFPDVLNPFGAGDMASRVYRPTPRVHRFGDDILVPDLASGPSGSSADYAAAFAAAIVGMAAGGSAGLALAAASARDANALAAAFSASTNDLPLALLLPEKTDEAFLFLPGEADPSPIGGSPVHLIEVRGDQNAAARLERIMQGRRIAGRKVWPVGAAAPARLVGRSLLLIGLFSLVRSGISGDLIVAAPPDDPLGLVTGLWAWSWGLPISTFLLSPEAWPSGEKAGTTKSPELAAGAELLACFDREHPLGSLLFREPCLPVDSAYLVLPDGLRLDDDSASLAAAARRALAGGLSGHSTFVVPRFSDPERAPVSLVRPAAEGRSRRRIVIDPTPEALEAALTDLL
jgi:hypothetical protein